jgi:threonine dehydratase
VHSSGWSIEPYHLALAREVVRRHARATPLEPLDDLLGPGAYAKLECAQETGSFKLRGALAALAALDPDVRARGVITASAGNHGAGLARAGAIFGVPVTVFVGSRAPEVKRARIASAGASIEVLDLEGFDDVDARAKEAASERGLAFVSAFDDPFVAAGNGGTLGLEILDALAPSAIVAPVGGGGLVAGLAAALRARGSAAQLVGVQSDACPAMLESFRAGRALTRFEGGPTLAEGLEGGVGESTYAIARAALARMETVREADIAEAMRELHRARDIAIEGSAAVALAWALAHRDELPRPFVVVLTGSNVDPAKHASIVG